MSAPVGLPKVNTSCIGPDQKAALSQSGHEKREMFGAALHLGREYTHSETTSGRQIVDKQSFKRRVGIEPGLLAHCLAT